VQPLLLTRLLLAGAYLVILAEVLRPFVDSPVHVSNPMWQVLGVIFVALNVLAFALLKQRIFLIALAALNATLGVATVIAVIASSLKAHATVGSDLDFMILACFFGGFVPLMAAVFLFSQARTPNNRWRGP
jgi:hypothetical protein